jgi:RNA polymerase sigma factor (sigma-70 family)
VRESVTRENFDNVVRTYRGYVYTITWRLLGNAADAEDAAQETFIKAFKRLKYYNESLGMKNWLCTIALNTARDFYRKSKQAGPSTVFEEGTVRDDEGERRDLSVRVGERIDIIRMLEGLDIRYRSVVVLFYMEQYSVKEIAEMLKKSESAVKVWLYRARKILLERFGESVV